MFDSDMMETQTTIPNMHVGLHRFNSLFILIIINITLLS